MVARHGNSVADVVFFTDGRYAASGSKEGTLRLLEIESGASWALNGLGGEVKALVFSPDGRQVVSSSSNGTLHLWDVVSGTSRVLADLDGPAYVAFTPDGRYVVSSWEDLRLWEVASGEQLANLYGDGFGGFSAFRLAPDGKSLAVGDSGGRVHLIDIILDEADKAAWLARRHD